MNRASWVCFPCRLGTRRDKYPHDPEALVRCPECGGACTNLGHKIPVPPRHKPGAWSKLRVQLRESRIALQLSQARHRVARIHALEKKIVELRARPHETARSRYIQGLEQQLTSLRQSLTQ